MFKGELERSSPAPDLESLLQPPQRRMLTVSEAAALLHISISTTRNWSNRGLLRTYRIGPRRDRRFLVGDVLELLQNPDNTP